MPLSAGKEDNAQVDVGRSSSTLDTCIDKYKTLGGGRSSFAMLLWIPFPFKMPWHMSRTWCHK